MNHNVYMREYRKKNPEKCRSWGRTSYLRNKKAAKKRHHRYYKKNRTKIIEINNRWREKNTAKDRLYGRNGTAKLKDQAIAAYGGKCSCCGERNREFLTIDHPKGRKAVSHNKTMCGARLYRWLKKKGYPKKLFRLLCMNCNFSIGMYGFCPHERIAARVIA